MGRAADGILLAVLIKAVIPAKDGNPEVMVWTMKNLSATKRAPAGMDGEISRKKQKDLLRQMRILRKAGNKSTKIDGEVKK